MDTRNVCMYVYICMCVCMYVFIMYVFIMYVCMYLLCIYYVLCVYVCVHVCMYVCVYVCMYECVHVCMYVLMCVCMYIYIYICMYVYVRVHVFLSHPLTYSCISPIRSKRCVLMLSVCVLYHCIRPTHDNKREDNFNTHFKGLGTRRCTGLFWFGVGSSVWCRVPRLV